MCSCWLIDGCDGFFRDTSLFTFQMSCDRFAKGLGPVQVILNVFKDLMEDPIRVRLQRNEADTLTQWNPVQ